MPFAERYGFFRMNTDDDDSVIRDGGYRLLRNGRIGNTSGEYSGTIENIRGNLKISDNNQLPTTGTNKVIGGRYIDSDGSYIFMLYNSNGQHGIYRLLDGTIIKIFEWSGLNFSDDRYIDHIDVIRNEIYWTDGINPPRILQIDKAINDGYPDIMSEEYISLIRRPPNLPLQVSRKKDDTYDSNFIKDNAFQFAYRYLYDNYKYSVMSPYSELIHQQIEYLPSQANEYDFNYLELAIPSGETVPLDVKKIQLYVKYNNDTSFYLIKELKRDVLIFDFYNDINGVAEDPILTSQSYDDVPLIANCQCFMDNRLMFANYKKDFNLPETTSLSVSFAIQPKTTLSNNDVWRVYVDDGSGNKTTVAHYIEDVYTTGQGVEISQYYKADYTGGVATQVGDTPVAYNINDLRDITPPPLPTLPAFRGVELASPTSVYMLSDASDLPSFKKGGTYRVGILFKDKYGRNTGVMTPDSSEVTIAEDPGDENIYTISWNLNSATVDEIPVWATHYQIVLTENINQTYFITGITNDVWYNKRDSDGNIGSDTYWKGNLTTGVNQEVREFLYLDVSDLGLNGGGYVYESGDLCKVWVPETNFATGLTELVDYTKNIVGYDGQYLKLEWDVYGNKLEDKVEWYYEIFRPRKTDLDIRFYETSSIFPINNVGESNRSFSTTSGTLTGDTYTLSYQHYHYLNPYDNTDPAQNNLFDSSNNFPDKETKYTEFMSPRIKNEYGWLKSLGKVSLLSAGEGEVHDTTSIVYGQQILASSNINDLNRFFTLDRYDRIQVDRSPIIKLTAISESLLLANHERSTTALYVGAGILEFRDNTEFLAKTQGVITDHRSMLGDFGAIKETIVSEGHRAWWLDIEKGLVIRYTQGGTEPISDDQYKFNSYIKDLSDKYKPYYKTNKIVGGYDPDFKEYYITFPEIAGLYEAQTIFFSETTQNWVGVIDFKDASGKVPELIGRTPKRMISFLNGELWEHSTNTLYNNFYGVQYDRKLTMVANVAPSQNKVWNNIWAYVDEISGDDDYEAIVVENHLGQKTIIYRDEMNLNEGAWKGPVWFDVNTSGFSTEVARREGDRIRSKYVDITINTSSSGPNPLKQVTVLFKISEFSI